VRGAGLFYLLMETDPKELMKKLMVVNPLVWADHMRIQLRRGDVFSLESRPYLTDLVKCSKRVRHYKKGSQIGLTTTKFLEAVHACYYRKYRQNVIYMMPGVKHVELLCKTSFDPIIDYNGFLKKVTSTNTASAKTINGRSIVFVGAQPQKVGENTKDSANLRSIPADHIMRDEIDLMDMDMVEMSKQRLNASEFRIEENFGSPTYPGYGIDYLYEQSDQHKWQIKCVSCGKYTCVAESFPDSIILKDKRWIRACIHCHTEIFNSDGSWISEYPDRREAGFWVDGFLSPQADLEEYMHRYHNSEGTRLSEFMRSILGIATTEAEHQLSKQQVLDLCGSDPISMYSELPTVMGVDVGGSALHVVIGIRTGKNTYEILNVSRVKDFGELTALSNRLKVKVGVIDSGPEYHQVKEYQKQQGRTIYRCQYSEQMMSNASFENGVVKCNRNEWCDKVHSVVSGGKVKLPRSTPEMHEFAHELTQTARTMVEQAGTGIPKPRWIKLGSGNDHYFHAFLYFLLAASKTSAVSPANSAPKFTKCKNNFCLR
jgi:hypothetical protein